MHGTKRLIAQFCKKIVWSSKTKIIKIIINSQFRILKGMITWARSPTISLPETKSKKLD